MPRRVIILGSTGSIGTQAIEVVRHLNALHAGGRFENSLEIVGLAAKNNVEVLAAQVGEFPAARIALATDGAANGHSIRSSKPLFTGPDAAERLIREVPCDLVIAAIVGSAGLPATLAAVELGRDVALANKETLVAAGALMVPAASRSGARLLPLDSEHAAVWQCLGCDVAPPLACSPSVARVILTASGGPFRTWTKDRIDRATPEEALKHPTWSMGAKVTIDSASLMNKALEIIEAHWLFGLPADRIEALIHPQSIVHAMVEMTDGALLAQMAPADMRIPIQQAIAWPRQAPGAWKRLDWSMCGKLEFEAPDLERFPVLKLAYEVINAGDRAGTSGAILNAGNEEAVAAFIAHKITFGRIPELAAAALAGVKATELRSLADVAQAEAQAREFVRRSISR
ncbi:MAG: 1-deoxy-D-xylulose-5-phosphate reductoisomerase [Phycisphaerales bacterium]|nr:1-deoxy-D-xylulose-5-phosphate reductoisomerase [Phycisphaerales bacterium]